MLKEYCEFYCNIKQFRCQIYFSIAFLQIQKQETKDHSREKYKL